MRSIRKFSNSPALLSAGSVGGKTEREGPLSSYFDITGDDTTFGAESWEKAEVEMVRMASDLALKKANCRQDDVDLVFAGDLLNQCTSSSFGMREKGIPYVGLYGACSTFALALGLAAHSVDSGFSEKAMACASSHFCSAERKYRYPIEYGNQRTPTSQTTVTGAGCALIGRSDKESIHIAEFLPGRIVDYKIRDANNMGAAMAPAAYHTLRSYFSFSESKPEDFDLILTGDLGVEGKSILLELCRSSSLFLGKNYFDCGELIYNVDSQDVHAGGSGCGCSASVFCGYVVSGLQKGLFRDVLLVGTGALLNAATPLQKETIPGIAHLVRIRKD